MILLKTEKILGWLCQTDRTQTWLGKELAKRMHREKDYTKGYISQIINNRCKLSIRIIENLLLMTCIPFESLFSYDGGEDQREFYGREIWDGKQFLDRQEYKKRANIFTRLFSRKRLDRRLSRSKI